MTSSRLIHSDFASRPRVKGMICSLEREFEQIDREAGHDYLPMDIYIDSLTIREHFREPSIRGRLRRSLSRTD